MKFVDTVADCSSGVADETNVDTFVEVSYGTVVVSKWNLLCLINLHVVCFYWFNLSNI